MVPSSYIWNCWILHTFILQKIIGASSVSYFLKNVRSLTQNMNIFNSFKCWSFTLFKSLKPLYKFGKKSWNSFDNGEFTFFNTFLDVPLKGHFLYWVILPMQADDGSCILSSVGSFFYLLMFSLTTWNSFLHVKVTERPGYGLVRQARVLSFQNL